MLSQNGEGRDMLSVEIRLELEGGDCIPLKNRNSCFGL